MSVLIFNSQNVSASKIINSGFNFKFPTLEEALSNLKTIKDDNLAIFIIWQKIWLEFKKKKWQKTVNKNKPKPIQANWSLKTN